MIIIGREMNSLKKKLVIGVLTGAILLGGAGTIAFAQTNGVLSFEDMEPRMQEVHPDLSTQELEQMYNSCHGEGGIMQGNPQGMMNNF
jgi:hypothetical protein